MASIINATTTNGVAVQGDNSGSLQLQTNNGTTAVTINTSQNVGVGTTTINDRLVVQSSSAEQGITIRGDGLDAIKIGMVNPSVSNDGVIGMKINNALRFITNNTERMRITSGGNVLVNKTATNFTDSGLQLDNNSGNAGRVISTKSASGSYSVFVNYYAGTYVGGIDMSNTATGFPTSSDIRLKKNIVDCPNALDKVNQMRIVSHDWKVDDSHVEYGVIAQELEPIAPQAVKKGDDGETVEQTWAVDYSKLVPILTKAIQELKAELDATKAEVQALKGVA